MTKFIYGTGNAGKVHFMREVFTPLDLHLMEIGDFSLTLPDVDESGNSPLENARIKALAYYKALREQTEFDYPLFSCDSGLYIEGLSEKEQPGVYARRVSGKSLTDEEMIEYYSSIAERLGGKVTARYRNAICFVMNANETYEYMGDDIASAEFLLVSKPHPKRESGFPLNSLSVHIDSGKYYNDLNIKPRNNSHEGFREFFRRVSVQHSMVHHYNALIEENNDPVHDPAPLKAHMDKWDGEAFIEVLQLSPDKSVLEIGVGTGRLATRICGKCENFLGIDISPKTVERAKENLREFVNVDLICGDFLTYPLGDRFDIIYSSLTFMHIMDKRTAIQRTVNLLKPSGRFVLSISKNQQPEIDYGSRQIAVYPDKAEEIADLITEAGLNIEKQFETEFAVIFAARKG